MSRSRIAVFAAERIAQAAVDDHFKTMEEANRKKLEDISERVYDYLTDAKTREWLKQAPEGWVHYSQGFEVRGSNGYQMKLSFAKSKLVKIDWHRDCWSSKLPILKDADLTQELLSCIEEKQSFKSQRSELYNKVKATVLGAGSYPKLRIAWPEGAAYYARFANQDSTKGTDLAVTFDDVNKALGLPKETAEVDA